jgi:hypothetical protein
VFDLARALRGIDGLDASPDHLRRVVQVWHGLALPHIRTKDFATTWDDFRVAWVRVKAPKGVSLGRAFAAAAADPDPPVDGRPELGLLSAACRELQGDGEQFFLSARAAAAELTKRLGLPVDRMTAWRWLQVLEFYGHIRSVQTGRLEGRRATTWRHVQPGGNCA